MTFTNRRYFHQGFDIRLAESYAKLACSLWGTRRLRYHTPAEIAKRFSELSPERKWRIIKSVSDLPVASVRGVFKAASNGSAPKTISGVASSTSVDLEGDRFEPSALQDMLGLKGLTSFLNHRYGIPDDVLGQVVDTSISRAKGGGQSLNVTIQIASDNPRAVMTHTIVTHGVRVGLSVGVVVLESTPITGSDGRVSGRSIQHVLPLECSAVGVPSNFDDARSQAAKSARRQREFTFAVFDK